MVAGSQSPIFFEAYVDLDHQDNGHLYPTLARIALDVLPCQASSVPCERLFSASKQVATDRRARLGAVMFEVLLIMKFAWKKDLKDIAAWNSMQIEEINLMEFEEWLESEVELLQWEKSDDIELVID